MGKMTSSSTTVQLPTQSEGNNAQIDNRANGGSGLDYTLFSFHMHSPLRAKRMISEKLISRYCQVPLAMTQQEL